MTRAYEEISLQAFINAFNLRSLHSVSIFVDLKNKDEIFDIIANNSDRFRRALYVLLQGNYNSELYAKENINKKTSNLTAFKFKRTKGSNYRIYCKEYFDLNYPNIKKVVMITSVNKRTQKVDKKLKTLLESIAKYEYEH